MFHFTPSLSRLYVIYAGTVSVVIDTIDRLLPQTPRDARSANKFVNEDRKYEK